MPDQSYLDNKYFIDNYVYNCPFCKRRNVSYVVVDRTAFNWTDDKMCYVYIVKCASCQKLSMHLTYTEIKLQHSINLPTRFDFDGDLDALFFHSTPTSTFVLDQRIPRLLRDLITEAEGCLQMNHLTGASACARKAIYELLVAQDVRDAGADYETRIKALKAKHATVDPVMFDVLSHIQDTTSDKVHEESWPKWDSPKLRLILHTLKAVLQEIYVIPEERSKQAKAIRELRERVFENKKPPARAVPPAATAEGNGEDVETDPHPGRKSKAS